MLVLDNMVYMDTLSIIVYVDIVVAIVFCAQIDFSAVLASSLVKLRPVKVILGGLQGPLDSTHRVPPYLSS